MIINSRHEQCNVNIPSMFKVFNGNINANSEPVFLKLLVQLEMKLIKTFLFCFFLFFGGGVSVFMDDQVK